MPNDFRVVTRRIFEGIDNSSGELTCALIVQNFAHSAAVLPFVQGPAAENTEAALRALLDKVETMIGKRWSSVVRMNAQGLSRPNYLER